MPHVSFTPNLRRHLPCPDLEVPGETVGAVLAAVFGRQPQLRSYLVDDQGALRRHVAIFVNEQMIRDRSGLSDRLSADDRVYVFQALSGG